ncbi:MAG: HDOD domain-containing protein [Gammaproteobacteria bacterium]
MAVHTATTTRPEQPADHGSAAALTESVRGLVSPPAVCARVLELVDSITASAADIGEVVACDPSLTSRLLRIVNSPLYGLRGTVDTVSRAVAVLGGRELVNLVVAVSAVSSFSKIPSRVVNMDTFWRHGVFCGLVARGLARRCKVLHPERLFVAGLLHDIGALVLYHKAPDVMQRLVAEAGEDEQRLFELERSTLGYSHAELGGMLLDGWSLPPALHQAVLWHHEPHRAGDAVVDSAIVHAAEALANKSGIGGYCEAAMDTEPRPEVASLLGFAPEALDLDEVLGEAGLAFAETVELLAVSR